MLGHGIDPLYNVDDYSKEAKYKLQIAHEQARQILEKSKLRNKIYYDKSIKPLKINLKDKVLLQKEPRHKLEAVYDGPYTVENVTDSNVEIQLVTKKNNRVKERQIVHKNRIRKYK